MGSQTPSAPSFVPEDEQMREHEILDPSQRPSKLSLQQVLAIASLTLLYNIALGGFVCIAPVLSYINADIGPSPDYTWLASSWTITSGIGLIVAGALSDIIGRRWFCVATGITGVIGGVIGAVAQDIPTGILPSDVVYVLQVSNKGQLLSVWPSWELTEVFRPPPSLQSARSSQPSIEDTL